VDIGRELALQEIRQQPHHVEAFTVWHDDYATTKEFRPAPGEGAQAWGFGRCGSAAD
jgi:hypothetical protein